MSKKEIEIQRSEYKVKPKHQVMVRGTETKEGQSVMLSDEEFNGLALIGGRRPVVHAAEFPEFIAVYLAGQVDCHGNTIDPAPEAEDNAEAAGE